MTRLIKTPFRGKTALTALLTGLAAVTLACNSSTSSAPTPAGGPTSTPAISPTPLSETDQRAVDVMFQLYTDPYENNSGGVQVPALRAARELGHPGLIPPLVEVTRFAVLDREISALGETLALLTGQSFAGDDYFNWHTWLGDQPHIQPLPRYGDWKAQLYAPFDSTFHRFLYDGVPSDIPLHGIQWGGVRRDGIPPLENPQVIPGNEVFFIEPDELVFGAVINGEARAYPFRIMNSHEMANDVLGGAHVTLAYCTLCGSGILYQGMVNGHTETFGTSGFLYQSNKLMYDRTTSTLWQQQTGVPVVGPLVGSGIRLEQLPLTVSRWSKWLEQHPDTTVLSLEQGFRRSYHHPDDPSAIYYDYFHTDDLLFPVWGPDARLEPKTRIFGLRFGENARAYIAEQALEERVINDELTGVAVVVIGDPGSGAVRAFRRGDRSFRPGDAPGVVADRDGNAWLITEEALVPEAPGLELLPRQTGQDAFWFGWTSFFPQTEVWAPRVER
jgi:hypothetical protein